MGNSADRAWQLSQLVEGVSTAFNPSHGSLSYVQAGHCVSKQIGRHDAACQGCPLCVSRSPEARYLRVFARAVRFSQPAVLSALLAIQLFGIVIPPPYFPKEHQKERCGHFSVAALLHYVLWCASEYSVVGRISCYVPYDSARTNVCQWLFAEIFSLTAAVSNRIDSIRNLYIFFALNFPTLENPILEKMNYRIQPSSHSSHASSSSSNQSGLSS